MIEKIYIINLERRKDKKEHMIKELNKLFSNHDTQNIDYVFWKGVDGQSELSSYNVQVIPNWKEPQTCKAITNGEIGCALSHYQIWQDICKNDDDDKYYLILEDDVVIKDNFLKLLDEYMGNEKVNKNIDMIYLGRKPLRFDKETKITDNIRKAEYSYWANAYMLSVKGARKLIETDFINKMMPVDEFLPIMYNSSPLEQYIDYFKEYEKLVCYAIDPLLVSLTDGAFLESETCKSDPFLQNNKSTNNFIVLTVATHMNDGLKRFIEYAKIYGVPYKILGYGEKWNGGNMKIGAGGGQKVNLLKRELSNWSTKELESTIVLVTDSYDVMIVSSVQDILNNYNKLAKDNPNKIFFSGEKYCWPDKSLADKYPKTNSPFKYLNSGGFIGYGNQIFDLIKDSNIKDNADDQLYYTQQYFAKHNIILDTNCQIFQTLGGTTDLKELSIDYNRARVKNKLFNNYPCILHGNGASNVKLFLNSLENYTGNNWNSLYGYNKSLINKDYKKVFIAAFIDKKDIDQMNVFKNYRTEIHIFTEDQYDLSVDLFLKSDADYYLYILKEHVITDVTALQDLINLDKQVVAPMLRRKGDMWTNFWGQLDNKGYYKRSFDYLEIINNRRKGCWNVPYINGVYLVKKQVFEKMPDIYAKDTMDLDMRFCHKLRNKDIFMYVTNIKNYGHIYKNITIMDIDYKTQWEKKYLHHQYYINKDNLQNLSCTELCKDAFNFPLFSEQFCDEIVALAEKYNKWSPGKNNYYDPRLGGKGHENFPTQDVHLNQLGFGDQWNTIIMSYVAPVASKLYSRYKTKGTNINFIVKYCAEGQPNLAPHHDASVYTINVALNRHGIDYEGGGCRFVRQNYSMVGQKMGTASIHPGRLTHYHEGLPTTSGKRYILVSFIN